MTQSIYLIGGAGVGKSTFMADMIDRLGLELDVERLVDLHATQLRNLVTLRGHEVFSEGEFVGYYLGRMRESFPGTDGLDRVSSSPGVEWLLEGGLPELIIAEGATLATRPFLTALHRSTRLLLLHLVASPDVVEARCRARGSEQAETFVQGTATRAVNLARDMRKLGVFTCQVNTEYPEARELALDLCEKFLAEGVARQ